MQKKRNSSATHADLVSREGDVEMEGEKSSVARELFVVHNALQEIGIGDDQD